MNISSEVIRQRLHARARVRHWLGFARVAELGSVHKAALAMGMTQPSLTQLLADLESLIGAPLFLRHARGMRLTTLGRELLPAARRILGVVDDTAEQAAALQATVQGVVRLGAISGAVAGMLAQALPDFARQHPDVLVQLIETDAGQLDLLLARGDLDLALCRAPAGVPEGWAFEPLIDDRFVVVAATGHPLTKARRVTLEQLRQQTWLALPPGSAAHAAFEALFASGEAPAPRLCHVSARVPAILWAMLKTAPLLALIPASLARQLVDAGELAVLRFDQAMPLEPIGVLYTTEGVGSGAERLLRSLRAAGQRVTSTQTQRLVRQPQEGGALPG